VTFIVTDNRNNPVDTAKISVQNVPITNQAVGTDGKVTFNQCFGFLSDATVTAAGFCSFSTKLVVDVSPIMSVPVELMRIAGMLTINIQGSS
jgi:hypothetical protein